MKYLTIILAISLIVGIFLFLDLKSEYSKYVQDSEVIVLKHKMSIMKKDSIINKNGEVIDNQKIVLTSQQDAINKIADEKFKLKKKDEKNRETIAYLQAELAAKVDSIFIPYKDSSNIEGKDSSALVQYIKDSTISVPKSVSYEDEWVSIDQTITKSGLQIDSITLRDTLSQRIVRNTNGWFGKEYYEYQSFHTSPYFKTTSKQSLLYVPKNTTKKVALVFLLLGIGTGLIISK